MGFFVGVPNYRPELPAVPVFHKQTLNSSEFTGIVGYQYQAFATGMTRDMQVVWPDYSTLPFQPGLDFTIVMRRSFPIIQHLQTRYKVHNAARGPSWIITFLCAMQQLR